MESLTPTVALMLALASPCPVANIRRVPLRPVLMVERGPAWGRDPAARPRFDGGSVPGSLADQGEALRAGREQAASLSTSTSRWRVPVAGQVSVRID